MMGLIVPNNRAIDSIVYYLDAPIPPLSLHILTVIGAFIAFYNRRIIVDINISLFGLSYLTPPYPIHVVSKTLIVVNVFKSSSSTR